MRVISNIPTGPGPCVFISCHVRVSVKVISAHISLENAPMWRANKNVLFFRLCIFKGICYTLESYQNQTHADLRKHWALYKGKCAWVKWYEFFFCLTQTFFLLRVIMIIWLDFTSSSKNPHFSIPNNSRVKMSRWQRRADVHTRPRISLWKNVDRLILAMQSWQKIIIFFIYLCGHLCVCLCLRTCTRAYVIE